MTDGWRDRWARRVDLPYRRLSHSYRLPDGSRRIYCYHIRKTGGTSLNRGFMALGGEDPLRVHERISASAQHRTISGGYAFVAFDRRRLAQGRYFYGWAHRPAHRQTLAPRDVHHHHPARPGGPGAFVLRLSRDRRRSEHARTGLRRRAPLGLRGFAAFLKRLPERDLLRQLYMFSASFDVAEAVDRIGACSHVHFVEENDAGVAQLSQRLRLPLVGRRERVTGTRTELPATERDQLRTLLEPEYELIRRLRAAGIGTCDDSGRVPDDDRGGSDGQPAAGE